MSEAIGIIGLGHMGIVAARKYVEAGYTVYGYARRKEVIEEFTSFGGRHAGNCREVAEKSGKVIVYVLNDQQVIDVVTGEDGILKGVMRERVLSAWLPSTGETSRWSLNAARKNQSGLLTVR